MTLYADTLIGDFCVILVYVCEVIVYESPCALALIVILLLEEKCEYLTDESLMMVESAVKDQYQYQVNSFGYYISMLFYLINDFLYKYDICVITIHNIYCHGAK